MALRLEETCRTVDTIQHVVARHDSPKTLLGIKVEMAHTTQEACDTVSYVRRHQTCYSTVAHSID